MKKIIFILFLLTISLQVFAQKIMIVTNSMNSTNQISRDQIKDFFFKRNRQWPDGKPIRFFDRLDNSQERSLFLKQYLGKTARQVDQFWIGQKFNTGDSAPIQVSTDSMTLNMVSRFSGGISYVKEGISLPKNVKILEISE